MSQRITRRELLRRGAAAGAVVTFPSVLAACGGGGGIEPQTAAQPGTTTTAEKKLADQLVVANWPYYIDVAKDKKTRPSLVQFTKETGVKVRYLEEVGTNEGWFGKYQAQLRQGDDIGRDIVVLTDWMATRMLKLGYVQKKDKSAIPNEKNLAPALKSPGFDPERDYSLPWQSGITGIAYNKKLTRPVTSLDQLLTDPKLKGKVTLLDDIASCMTLTLLANGDDPTKVTPEAFDRGIQTLQEGLDSGQIRSIPGNEYPDDMLAGNVWAGMAWSGDVLNTLQPENPNFEFVVPDDGGEIFTDNMLIPNGGDVFTASTFMNYVYEPAVAAQIETGALYICPVVGAKEEMLKIDPSLAKNELVFPSEKTLSKVEIFDSEAAQNPEFTKKFSALQGT